MQIIQDRRALHRIPELDVRLPETLAYLKCALAELNCHVFSPMESALCAFFDFGAEKAQLVFGIAGIGDEHLDLLSNLCTLLEDPARLETLKTTDDVDWVLDQLS